MARLIGSLHPGAWSRRTEGQSWTAVQPHLPHERSGESLMRREMAFVVNKLARPETLRPVGTVVSHKTELERSTKSDSLHW